MCETLAIRAGSHEFGSSAPAAARSGERSGYPRHHRGSSIAASAAPVGTDLGDAKVRPRSSEVTLELRAHPPLGLLARPGDAQVRLPIRNPASARSHSIALHCRAAHAIGVRAALPSAVSIDDVGLGELAGRGTRSWLAAGAAHLRLMPGDGLYAPVAVRLDGGMIAYERSLRLLLGLGPRRKVSRVAGRGQRRPLLRDRSFEFVVKVRVARHTDTLCGLAGAPRVFLIEQVSGHTLPSTNPS